MSVKPGARNMDMRKTTIRSIANYMLESAWAPGNPISYHKINPGWKPVSQTNQDAQTPLICIGHLLL